MKPRWLVLKSAPLATLYMVLSRHVMWPPRRPKVAAGIQLATVAVQSNSLRLNLLLPTPGLAGTAPIGHELRRKHANDASARLIKPRFCDGFTKEIDPDVALSPPVDYPCQVGSSRGRANQSVPCKYDESNVLSIQSSF